MQSYSGVSLTEAEAVRQTIGVPALAAQGVVKAFPGVIANDRVDFELACGEVHALLGENGSGKTTLCKILTGLYRPDEGQVFVHGQPVIFGAPAAAYQAGIFMVHQHFSLVEPMTVAENVVLGWTKSPHWRFDRKMVEEDVAAAGERFDLKVNPRELISNLSVGEKQKVEILKALYRGAKTLILDEPTTVLTPQEAGQLFASLRRMADAGGSVIFISHKLDEVSELCDRVTVLRKGKTSGTSNLRANKVDAKGLARLMVGRDIHLMRKTDHGLRHNAEPVLQLEGVSAQNTNGNKVLSDVSLTVRAGEVLGVAGVAGNGQLPLAEVIAGLRDRVAGDIKIRGRSIPSGNVRAAIEAGIAYIPEDRMGVGLAPGLKVTENIALKSYRSPENCAGPFVKYKKIHQETLKLIDAFKVKGTADNLIRQLSGGNAQKVLLARELSSAPQLLVVATPTRGLDVSAMETIRDLLIEASCNGLAVILLSEDLGEILDLADRVAVICGGKVQGIVEAEGADIDEIGLMMMGQAQDSLKRDSDTNAF